VQLDIPTIMVMVIASSLLVGLILPSARDARSVPGFREATLGSWLLAAAFVAQLLRGHAPPFIPILFGNSLIWISVALHWNAYRRFNDPDASPRRLLLATLAAVPIFAAVWASGASYVVRSSFSSTVIGTLTAAGAWELARGGGIRKERSRVIGIALGLLVTACMIARIVVLWTSDHIDEHFLGPSPERTIAFFPAMLYALGTGLGFLVMHRERSDARSRELALTDPMTGCANRRALEDRVRSELEYAARTKKPLALIVADIDRFKSINDTHGHAIGDDVIRHLGGVLRRGARGSDTVARYGGEEFCVLMRDADVEGAATLAGRLRAALTGTPVVTRGPTLQVTASFGVAAFDPARPEDWESIFRRADAALYTAKQNGRDRVERGLSVPPSQA
jgi:diguanylate cyclase (GGDEF)-like protein